MTDCTIVPTETGGPFPGDGSNGPDVLAESGIAGNTDRHMTGSTGVHDRAGAPVDDRAVRLGQKQRLIHTLCDPWRSAVPEESSGAAEPNAGEIAKSWNNFGVELLKGEGKVGGAALPMGFNRTPHYRDGLLLVGDAGGMVNPFNGEGIAYAYETGRIAADALELALATGNGLALQRYPERLEELYGLYFKVARVFAKVIGNPELLGRLTQVGMHSRTLMEWVLRIMANLLRPDELGPAEAAYRSVAAIARLVPERPAA